MAALLWIASSRPSWASVVRQRRLHRRPGRHVAVERQVPCPGQRSQCSVGASQIQIGHHHRGARTGIGFGALAPDTLAAACQEDYFAG